MKLSKYQVDFAERVAATAAEAGLAVVIVEVGTLPGWWVPVLMPVLAAAKGALAKWLGRADTAAALSARSDPASRA